MAKPWELRAGSCWAPYLVFWFSWHGVHAADPTYHYEVVRGCTLLQQRLWACPESTAGKFNWSSLNLLSQGPWIRSWQCKHSHPHQQMLPVFSSYLLYLMSHLVLQYRWQVTDVHRAWGRCFGINHLGHSLTHLSSSFIRPLDQRAGGLIMDDLKVYQLENALVPNSHY